MTPLADHRRRGAVVLLGVAAAAGVAVALLPPVLLLVVITGAVGLVVLATVPRLEAFRFLLLVAWAVNVFFAEASVFGITGATATTPDKIVANGFLAAMAVAVLYFTGDSRPHVVAANPMLRWLIYYIAWMAVCAVFSDLPLQSELRTLQAAVPVMGAIAFLRASPTNRMDLALATWAGCFVHVVWALVRPRMVGPDPLQMRQVGLMVANSFSLAAVVTAVTFAAMAVSGRRSRLWLVGLVPVVTAGTWGVVASRGRTGAIALVVGLLVVLLARSTARYVRLIPWRKVARFAVVLTAPFVVARYAGVVLAYFGRGADAETIRGLTGRTAEWAFFLQEASRRPFTGFGPGAIRFNVVSDAATQAYGTLGSAHNAAVEVIVTTGLVGLVFWAAAMFLFFRAALAHRGGDRPLVLANAALLVLFGSTLAHLAGFGIAWHLFLATAVLVLHVPVSQRVTAVPAEVQQ